MFRQVYVNFKIMAHVGLFCFDISESSSMTGKNIFPYFYIL